MSRLMSNIKKIMKLLLPPILTNILVKIKRSLFISQIHTSTIQDYMYIEKSTKVFIVGNGPSLNKTFDRHINFIKQFDCMVVNFFANTEYFTILKPKFYVLADTAFFENLDKKNPSHKKFFELINVIKSKTTWKIKFIVPDFARSSAFITSILENKNITVLYFSTKSYNISNQFELFKLYDEAIIYPPAQTVLNTCLYLAILWKYKEVFLIGADTSWLSNLYVDQKTNDLYTNDEHYYGRKKTFLEDPNHKGKSQRIAQQLTYIRDAFILYDTLAEYAKYKNVKVYNASDFSFITSFERVNLKDIKL